MVDFRKGGRISYSFNVAIIQFHHKTASEQQSFTPLGLQEDIGDDSEEGNCDTIYTHTSLHDM